MGGDSSLLLSLSGFCDRVRFRLRRNLAKDFSISDDSFAYKFRCDERIELIRARTLFTKEEGTVRWISDTVSPGDVFYDIGANIGVYTIMAAVRVGPAGRVIAFEPHLGNAMRLLENIRLNHVEDRVVVLSLALHEKAAILPFNYRHHLVGSSRSQLGDSVDEYGVRFAPESVELKVAETVDNLLSFGVVDPPTHIKIDVDGNEYPILCGMRQLLASEQAPRWIQVEVNPAKWDQIREELLRAGYTLSDRNYTALGKLRLERADEEEAMIPFNALFSRPAPDSRD